MTADWRYIVKTQKSLDSINRLRKIRNVGSESGQETISYLLKSHFPTIEPTVQTEYAECKLSSAVIQAYKEDWLTN